MQDFEIAQAVEGWTGAPQDRVAVIKTHSAMVLAVADGAGETAGGAEAASLVIERIRSAVARETMDLTSETWCQLLNDIDRELHDRLTGQTTAVVASMTIMDVEGASVGDSEAWLIRPEGHIILTNHQQRKPLLGEGAAIPVAFEALHGGSAILMGTDGLFKYTSYERIQAISSGENLSDVVRQLVDSVRLKSGGLQDDVGIAMCRPGAGIIAHKHCGEHRDEILGSSSCGCFYCLSIFPPEKIVEWIDKEEGVGRTAICPSCEIDSVIGSASGYPITRDFLRAMKRVWF